MQVCEREDETSSSHWTETNCATGQTCREGTTACECVFADRPCTAGSCTGAEALHCGTSGFVTGSETCDADATCELAGGRVACVYTNAICPASGLDRVCGADGVTVYFGCSDGFGAATHRLVCDDPAFPHCTTLPDLVYCGP